MLFDASTAKETRPLSRPMEEQSDRESQKLWAQVNVAIKNRDHVAATDEKSKIEDMQRDEAAKRGDKEWQPRLFRAVPAGDEENLDWIINADLEGKSEKQAIEHILSIAPVLPASEMKQSSGSQPAQQSSTSSQGQQGSVTQDSKQAIANPQGQQGSVSQQPKQVIATPQLSNSDGIAAPTIERTNSVTSEVEEFVDAEQ